MNTVTPRIYVACLASYNNGRLYGEWIDANQDTFSLYEKVKNMLVTSPEPDAEEFAIHDYEGFGDLRIEEYASLKKVTSFAEFIAENGDLGSAVLAHADGDIKAAQNLLDECYHGEYDTEEDFAYYWVHEVDGREVSQFLRYYIDYKAIARDFFINDFFSLTVSYKVHVFSHR